MKQAEKNVIQIMCSAIIHPIFFFLRGQGIVLVKLVEKHVYDS